MQELAENVLGRRGSACQWTQWERAGVFSRPGGWGRAGLCCRCILHGVLADLHILTGRAHSLGNPAKRESVSMFDRTLYFGSGSLGTKERLAL